MLPKLYSQLINIFRLLRLNLIYYLTHETEKCKIEAKKLQETRIFIVSSPKEFDENYMINLIYFIYKVKIYL